MDKKFFISIVLVILLFSAMPIVFPSVKASSFEDNSISKLIGISGTSIFHNQTVNLAKEYGIKSGKELQTLQGLKIAAKPYSEGDKEEFWCADNWYAIDEVDNDGDGEIDELDEYMYKINATCKNVC